MKVSKLKIASLLLLISGLTTAELVLASGFEKIYYQRLQPSHSSPSPPRRTLYNRYRRTLELRHQLVRSSNGEVLFGRQEQCCH